MFEMSQAIGEVRENVKEAAKSVKETQADVKDVKQALLEYSMLSPAEKQEIRRKFEAQKRTRAGLKRSYNRRSQSGVEGFAQWWRSNF